MSTFFHRRPRLHALGWCLSMGIAAVPCGASTPAVVDPDATPAIREMAGQIRRALEAVQHTPDRFRQSRL
jgi:hypothetical protein